MKKGVIGILSGLSGAAIGATITGKMMIEKVDEIRHMSEKHLALFLMMNQWVKIKQEGKKLASYFEQKGYYEIAVYGMSYAGETLIDELEGSSIVIKYGIDKKVHSIYEEFEVVSPDDKLERVDAVVVTPITFFEEIKECLRKKLDCPILSLEDVLYEI